jgi:hypothetical protein
MPIFEAFALAAPEVVGTDIAAEEAARLAAEEAARQAAIQAAQEEAARVAAQQAAQQGITQASQFAPPDIGTSNVTNLVQNAGPGVQTASASNAIPESLSRGIVPNTGGATEEAIRSSLGKFPVGPETSLANSTGSLLSGASAPVSPYSISSGATTEGLKAAGAEGIKAASIPAQTSVLGEPSALSKGWDTATTWMGQHPYYTAAGAYLGASKLGLLDPKKQTFNDEKYTGPLSRYQMSSDFQARHADPTQYQYTPRYAEGGIMGYAAGGPVEQMSNNAAIGANTMYPMANMATSAFATPYQDPKSTNMMSSMAPSGGGTVDAMSGEPNMQGTRLAAGGQVPRYGGGGIFGDISNTVGDALAGVGQFANNLTQGRVSIGRPDSAQTADQIAKKYYTNTAPAQNVNPQQYQYSPQYAEGGVARFNGARGSNLTNSLNYYTDILGGERERQIAEASNPIGGKGDAGIVRDSDPDTAYLSAPEAAAVRMGKINAKANMQGLTLPRPKPVGRLNLKPQGVKQAEASGSSLDPEMAAQGGIMHSSLGGYAAGGNPRLLKGPGDGMSDNIPATIADRQPARLADGEFVVPADVVSHLGNGSTDAGAKKLHEMMNKVRKARTGNPKQGKQINPNKFIPR